MALNKTTGNYECDYCHAIIPNPRIRKVNGKEEVQRFCSGTSCKNNWHNAQKVNKEELVKDINNMTEYFKKKYGLVGL